MRRYNLKMHVSLPGCCRGKPPRSGWKTGRPEDISLLAIRPRQISPATSRWSVEKLSTYPAPRQLTPATVACVRGGGTFTRFGDITEPSHLPCARGMNGRSKIAESDSGTPPVRAGEEPRNRRPEISGRHTSRARGGGTEELLQLKEFQPSTCARESSVPELVILRQTARRASNGMEDI